MPDIIITDGQLAILLLLLACMGACVVVISLAEICKWFFTRKHKRKYQVTIVTHCDVLRVTRNDKDTTQ